MIKTFTQNDIVRFAYGETSYEESCAIETAIAEDFTLRRFFENIKAMQRKLDNLCSYEPSEKTLQNIFSYSKSKAVSVAPSV
jgi:hypothetical protein